METGSTGDSIKVRKGWRGTVVRGVEYVSKSEVCVWCGVCCVALLACRIVVAGESNWRYELFSCRALFQKSTYGLWMCQCDPRIGIQSRIPYCFHFKGALASLGKGSISCILVGWFDKKAVARFQICVKISYVHFLISLFWIIYECTHSAQHTLLPEIQALQCGS